MAVPPQPSPLLIPRTFHWVWLGGKKMPDEFVAFRRSWARLHPDWQIIVWDEASLPPLRNQQWFDQLPTWSQKVDLASFEILHRHGGVYLDTDFECFRNIEPLLRGLDWFGASEDDVHTCHGIVGAVPGHPLIDRIVEGFSHSIASQPGAGAAQTTGPHHITRIVDAWRAEGKPLTVFGPELFYPYHYTEKHRRHETFPDAYAAHHWAGSWLPENQPAKRRLVLVDDPADPARHVGPLSAFCRLFGPADPVELAIACPAGGEARAAERVTALLGALADVDPLPELWVNTYNEVLAQPFDVAVGTTGDAAADALASAAAIEWACAVRAELDGGALPAPAPAGSGDPASLRLALAA
jgi:hypothetical protein